MSVKVGIVGLGFMGSMHLTVYHQLEGAEVIAICDIQEEKLNMDRVSAIGNIQIPEESAPDLRDVNRYPKIEALLDDPEVELVDVCLPTDQHPSAAIAALDAGKHVLVEKPIALSLEEAGAIVKAAETARGKLMVAQCIRFWPEYRFVKEVLADNRYGKVMVADFRRLSPTPTWTWDGWILDEERSGGAMLDLHIHDVDYINHLFGMPKSVFSRGMIGSSGGIDHVTTTYTYDGGPVVTAQGGWAFPSAYPFSMSFTILCERATIEFSSAHDPMLTIYSEDGEASYPKVETGDGYLHEIGYFLDCIQQDKDPEVVRPSEAMDSLAIILKERESCKTGAVINLSGSP